MTCVLIDPMKLNDTSSASLMLSADVGISIGRKIRLSKISPLRYNSIALPLLSFLVYDSSTDRTSGYIESSIINP